MQDKTKNVLISFGFVIILITVFILNILIKDNKISLTEKRNLAQFPKITIEELLNENVSKKLEQYTTDQFIKRDNFRAIKTFFNTKILMQKDNNKLFEKDGAIYKIDYPLNEVNINKSADKIKNVYEKYLKNMNVYYAIILDKNYYLKDDDHLKLDYNKVEQIMKNKLSNFKYINISDSLRLEDYYKTDLHWKQENLFNVVNKIENSMNLNITKKSNYKQIDVGEFFGTYYGQLAIKTLPDKMYILTNNTIENSETYNYETKKEGKVYSTNFTQDKYDIYLEGATPLISIENKNANTKKELLLFRDSFGSSIAPLLLENYSKITLIDLRYISSNILNEYIDFNNQDVLFLYSTVILNQNILK